MTVVVAFARHNREPLMGLKRTYGRGGRRGRKVCLFRSGHFDVHGVYRTSLGQRDSCATADMVTWG